MIKESIKSAATCTPKTANLKIFLLLFSHRVTRIGNQVSRTFFVSNAQVRPIKGGVFFRNAMKKSRSLFSWLKNGGLYIRHPVDAGGAFADVHIEKRPAKVHQSRLKLCALCVLGGVNLGNFYLSNQFNLRNLRLKFNQSKNINYAKRTQFPKKSNGCNISSNNELQRKMDNGHLVKTNPNKANLSPPNKPGRLNQGFLSVAFSQAGQSRNRFRNKLLRPAVCIFQTAG